MKQEELDRINALARKSREGGLTDAEAAEQRELRARYLADFRRSLMAQLDHTVLVDEKGNRRPLARKATPEDASAAFKGRSR